MAADNLYEENGRITFPNVDTVRRRARVNMNDASSVMRVWRRERTAAAAPLPASIPGAVQDASQTLLTAVWTAATNSANANLQTAQAGWEQERAEAEACRQQLASAFDSQSDELATAQRNVDAMEQKFAVQENELQAAATSLEKHRQEAEEAKGWAATAEARAKEIGQRADDLKTELARAHASADQERLDSKHRLEATDSTIASLRDELRQRLAQENDVREELARLRGQVDAMAEERQSLLATLKPNAQVSTPTKRPTATKTKSPNGT